MNTGTTQRNITLRIGLIALVVVSFLVALAVRGESGGFTFATNTNTGTPPLELKINAKTFYNNVLQPQLTWNLKNLVPGVDKFWNFGDVKPGDTGTSSISIHIQNGPAYVCLDFYNYKDKENGINEPESHVDTSSTTGELGTGLEFFAWKEGDGDYKFEPPEAPLFGTTTQSAVQVLNNKTYAIADSLIGNPIQNGVVKYVGVYWCAGDLDVNLTTGAATCNGEVLGNEAQTDSMEVDVAIRAVVASQNPKFTCNGVPPPVNWCEFEGHKYDASGKPLQGWDIGLMKKITHNKGVDMYDLATSTTDANGYFCLDWNGEKRTPINTPTYKSGPYTHEYFVYEKMKNGWQIESVEKGPHWTSLQVVPSNQIITDGIYRMISMGSGYIQANAGYHVDFYNKEKQKTYAKRNGSHSWEPQEGVQGFTKVGHEDEKSKNEWKKVDEKKASSVVTDALKKLKKKFAS